MVDLLLAISNKLNSVFPDVPIHLGSQAQLYSYDHYDTTLDKDLLQVDRPCFFIFLVESELERQFADRFFLNNLVNINYMSDEENTTLFDLEQIRLKMLSGMEMIQLTDESQSTDTELGPNTAGVSGYNLKCKIIDKDIVMSVNYDIWVEKLVETPPYMKDLDLDINVKDEDVENDIKQPSLDDYIDNEPLDTETDYMRKINKDFWRIK